MSTKPGTISGGILSLRFFTAPSEKESNANKIPNERSNLREKLIFHDIVNNYFFASSPKKKTFPACFLPSFGSHRFFFVVHLTQTTSTYNHVISSR